MRKYTGKYPHRVNETTPNYAPGVCLARTENGGAYFTRDIPLTGESIFDYRFQRVQSMTFRQEATCFHRILDGYAIPFVEYPAMRGEDQLMRGLKLDEFEKGIRQQFIQDMVRQNILPRFQEKV